MDDIGTRMDELEQSIASLLHQAGLDQNGFSNIATVETSISLRMQSKATLQSASPMAHQSTRAQPSISSLSAAISPIASPQAPVSRMNDSSSTQSLSPIESLSDHNNHAETPARARITIEI
jgi:hypothetical protein